MVTPDSAERTAWQLLESVVDPEIPAISVVDLGVVRAVEVDGNACTVTITPTYSGCPALEVIERTIASELEPHFASVAVRTTLSPAWTTDWISESGRERLRSAGIAPPLRRAAPAMQTTLNVMTASTDDAAQPSCPRCNSRNVERLAQFGSTACKALWRCNDCREPFDYFKPL